MRSRRRNHSPGFKAKVALALIKGGGQDSSGAIPAVRGASEPTASLTRAIISLRSSPTVNRPHISLQTNLWVNKKQVVLKM